MSPGPRPSHALNSRVPCRVPFQFRKTGVHLGVHNPRTLRHSSDTGKGNELAKSFVRCLSPVALKSLGPLACVGSTPTPGTSCFQRLTGQVNEGDEKPLTSMVSIWVSMNRPASRAYSRRDERGIQPAFSEFEETYAW